ncbi:MAG: hypothetical protein LC792_10855, partial [Actinobacteria bacterium]|nr:hypothetical protein [Actinomycetota bacterium]
MKLRFAVLAGVLAVPFVGMASAQAAVGCVVNGVTVLGDHIAGTEGNDYIDCSKSTGPVEVVGLGGNDRILGSNYGDVIFGDTPGD